MALVVDEAGADGERVPTGEQSTERQLRVRLFEERDTEVVRDIKEQHDATTVFRDQVFPDCKLNEHISLILSRPPRMIGSVVTLDGKPIGVAWVIADSCMLSDGPLFVTVHVIAVDLTVPAICWAKAFLALVAAISWWAASLNASHNFIHVATSSSIEATDLLLRASGTRFLGEAYLVWKGQL